MSLENHPNNINNQLNEDEKSIRYVIEAPYEHINLELAEPIEMGC